MVHDYYNVLILGTQIFCTLLFWLELGNNNYRSSHCVPHYQLQMEYVSNTYIYCSAWSMCSLVPYKWEECWTRSLGTDTAFSITTKNITTKKIATLSSQFSQQLTNKRNGTRWSSGLFLNLINADLVRAPLLCGNSVTFYSLMPCSSAMFMK